MEKLSPKLESKPKATIGIVQIPSDIPLDVEIGPLLSQIPGVIWRTTKMRFDGDDDDICEEVYARAQKNIAKAAETFLPTDNNLYGGIDVLALCCTSLSFTLGIHFNIYYLG